MIARSGGRRLAASVNARTPLVAALALAILTGCVSLARSSSPALSSVDWAVYGGAPTADHYSPLAQINKANVRHLAEAWRFETGEGELQTSPLMIGGRLYGIDPHQGVFALDAATGRVLWRHEPAEAGLQPARGLTYWTDGTTQRLYASSGSFLVALDADTGHPVAGFGAAGRVDLRQGLGRDPAGLAVYLTSPGTIFGDLIITGFRTSETHPAAPGAIRAYDVRTGALRWRFNLIPHPGEPGAETWPSGAWQRAGGANNWPGMALDTRRGIVYVPTGSAVDDFYGADRLGANLYANSLLALDARTGRLLWHFQAVHHDIWDRDFPSAPVLLSVRHGGRMVDAVAQTTKQGVVYLFDRVTGAPLFPIEERTYPASDVPGERAWPTQPMPLRPAPFARQRLVESDLTNRTPEAHAAVLKALRSYNNKGPFTPLRIDQPTIVLPGYDGGAEWGGPAADRRGVLYVNSNDVPWLGTLAARAAPSASGGSGEGLYQSQCSGCHGRDRRGSPPAFPNLTQVGARLTSAQIEAIIKGGIGRMPGFPQLAANERAAIIAFLRGEPGAPAVAKHELGEGAAGNAAPYQFTGYQKFLDPDGYPAVKPPWGTLSAIDLNSGELIWKVPLGEYPELAAKGIRNTGSENYGGPVVTASGLLIIAATLRDQQLRIFDSATGKLLWNTKLPYAGMATPITYSIGGRQYIVIATNNGRNLAGPKGSAYVAFALQR